MISEWHVLDGRARKFVALLCLGIFPVIWGLGLIRQNTVYAKSVEFCTKCHNMVEYVESLKVDDDEPLSGVHYQNNWVPQKTACYDCHTEYSMYGPLKAKFRGLKHVWVYYVTGAPKKLKLYNNYKNDDCLRCHGVAKGYLKDKDHRKDKKLLAQMEKGERSCLEKGCHDMGHLLASDIEDDFDDLEG